MTRDEILAMEPGREVDVLVAEDRGLAVKKVAGEWFYKDGSVHFRVERYSTDISAAMGLVAEIEKEHGLVENNGFLLLKEDGRPWYCEIRTPNTWEDAEGDTAPEAICKAYLLWRESEND